jgi:hypothetical protein
MNFITGKHLPRRTFLHGAGASVALPLLDGMLPAGSGGRAAAAATDVPRLVAIEIVHGAAGSNEWGAKQFLWAPQKIGRGFDISVGSLSPLEPYRDTLTIISNTDTRMAEAYIPQEVGGDHFRSSAVFLTQAHPTQTESSDVFCGTSIDQIFAQRFGQTTAIPSMQLCIENVDQAGGCAYGYSCVYTDAISWASPHEPLPMIRDPRVAFDQLFGAGGTAAGRAQRRKTQRSILDWIAEDVAKLQRELRPADRERMDQYLENIRELERRIQRVEAQNSSGEPRELPAAPKGVPDSFSEHVRLMMDLQVLAFESDMTRVFSFKFSRDATGRVYPESGSDTAFHPASHHGGKPESVVDFSVINRYHVSMLPYLMDKLKASTDGEKNLLDRTMIVYGSPMADGNLHNHRRCPLIVLGGANGKHKGGVHVKAADGTPMANAMLTMLHKLGVEDLEGFGDSTGTLSFEPPDGATTDAME